MPDTKEYITKLMNRNDDDLDDILSFADNIRSHVAMKKESKRADDILEEILSDSHDISAEDPVKNEMHSDSEHTENSVKEHTEKKEESPVFTQVLPVVHNYHHVLIPPEQFRYVPTQYIKHDTESALVSNPIISDEPVEENKKPITVSLSKPEHKQSQEKEIHEDRPKKNDKQIDKHKHNIFDDIDESDPDNAEEFISSQGMKHPKFYLVMGISIFFLTLFGIGSCIYLGLSALRKFCESYS